MLKILVIQIVIISFVLAGWIMSIVKLTQCDFKPSYKAEVIYALGVIPPVGAIVGWLNIEDVVE